jgi:hypothetical protein
VTADLWDVVCCRRASIARPSAWAAATRECQRPRRVSGGSPAGEVSEIVRGGYRRQWFAGSLWPDTRGAGIRSSVLLERGTHPRFAIGESSTPLANLSSNASAFGMGCRTAIGWRPMAAGWSISRSFVAG